MEARRQQRKLNFLITQTELYAHFMAKKLGIWTLKKSCFWIITYFLPFVNPGNPDAATQHDLILGHLDEETNPQLAYLDDYDSEATKQRVMNNVNTAFHAHQQQTKQFDDQDDPGLFPSNESQRK